MTTMTASWYIPQRMRLSLFRLVATLLLTGQILPVGLPLLCDEAQRRTAARAPAHSAGKVFGEERYAIPTTDVDSTCAHDGVRVSCGCAGLALAIADWRSTGAQPNSGPAAGGGSRGDTANPAGRHIAR